jgi:Domain of unknown function (DUF4157)
MLVITADELKRNFPKLVEWVIQRERICIEIGERLSTTGAQDALAVGVGQIDAVRILVQGEITLPNDPELRQLFLNSGLGALTGLTCGHGIFIKAGAYGRRLIAHELAHVMQYERFGGIESFLVAYLPEVISPPYYPNGPLEREAEQTAKIVCSSVSR